MVFLVSILSRYFFSNTFKYLWNLLENISSAIIISIKSFSYSFFSSTIFAISISSSTFDLLNSLILSLYFFFFYFCHPGFFFFIFHYFLHSLEYVIIFTSLIFQSISELWHANYSIPKITLYFSSPITSISVLSLYPL